MVLGFHEANMGPLIIAEPMTYSHRASGTGPIPPDSSYIFSQASSLDQNNKVEEHGVRWEGVEQRGHR